MITTAQVVREVGGVATLLRTNGASLPPAVTESRDRWHAIRQSPPASLDLRNIGALALDESFAKASKALTTARTAVEVHGAAVDVAAQRALTTLIDHRDEIVNLLLTSPRITSATATIAEVAPTTNSNIARFPGPGAPEDDVIAAARLRKAEDRILSLLKAIDSHVNLGTHFDPERAPLVWIDPSGVSGSKAFAALRKSLAGFRSGAAPFRATVVSARGGLPEADPTPVGIASASASAVDGIAFRRIDSYAEYLDRVSCVEQSGKFTRTDSKDTTKVTVL